MFGTALWIAPGPGAAAGLAPRGLVWLAVLGLTCRRSLLRRGGRSATLVESCTVFCGALVFRAVLIAAADVDAGPG